MTPVTAAIAAEAVVVLATFLGAGVIVNGHTIWGVLVGLLQ